MAISPYGYQSGTWLDRMDDKFIQGSGTGEKPKKKKQKKPTTLDSMADELKEKRESEQAPSYEDDPVSAIGALLGLAESETWAEKSNNVQNKSQVPSASTGKRSPQAQRRLNAISASLEKSEANRIKKYGINSNPGLVNSPPKASDVPVNHVNTGSERMKGSGSYAMDTEALEASTSEVYKSPESKESADIDWAGAAMGAVAGYQSINPHGDPYNIESTYKPSGLDQTSFGSNMVYQGLQQNKKSDSNFMVADAWQGIFSGAISGFMAGGPIGAIVGGVIGGVGNVISGDEKRTEYKKYIRDEERAAKADWMEQSNAIARVGSRSGAYQSDYKPISQLAIDYEKRKLNEELKKRRQAMGMSYQEIA